MLKKGSIYVFLFIFICGCVASNKKEGTEALASKECEKLKRFISKENLIPEEALQAMLQYYKKGSPIKDYPDFDLLRFRYGPFTEHYKLEFRRQLINPENGEAYQIYLVLLYDLDIFGSLLKYENWSMDNPDIKTWAEGCRKSKGFDYATRFSDPVKHDVFYTMD